jgi:hypothetical protein
MTVPKSITNRIQDEMLIKVETANILDTASISMIEESPYEWRNAQPGYEWAIDQHKDK